MMTKTEKYQMRQFASWPKAPGQSQPEADSHLSVLKIHPLGQREILAGLDDRHHDGSAGALCVLHIRSC